MGDRRVGLLMPTWNGYLTNLALGMDTIVVCIVFVSRDL